MTSAFRPSMHFRRGRLAAVAVACLAAVVVCLVPRPAMAEEDGAPSADDAPAATNESGAAGQHPGIFADDGAAYDEAIAEKRGIEISPDAIHDEQSRILSEQNAGAGEALFSTTNRFTESIDRWQASTFRWLDNAIRSLDLRWSSAATDYHPEISTFVLALFARAGGRSDEHRFDAKARFRADIELPGLEQRLRLVADNVGRDELPDTDPMKRESDLRVGVQSRWKSFLGDRWDLGGGLRLHSLRPIGYVDLEWTWSGDLFGGKLCFSPRGVWYTDDGFGQDASLTWTGPRTGSRIWQLVFAETTKESISGIQLEGTVRLAVPIRTKGCGWLFQASVFPHLHEEGHSNFDDFVVNATWRAPLYRRWIYYHITPQVDFADEDDHDPQPSLRFGCEILFGRETGDLL